MVPWYMPSSKATLMFQPTTSCVPFRLYGSDLGPARLKFVAILRFTRRCFNDKICLARLAGASAVAFCWVTLLVAFWLARVRLAVRVRVSSGEMSCCVIKPLLKAFVLAGIVKDGLENSWGATRYFCKAVVVRVIAWFVDRLQFCNVKTKSIWCYRWLGRRSMRREGCVLRNTLECVCRLLYEDLISFGRRYWVEPRQRRCAGLNYRIFGLLLVLPGA